ncbi:MAG: hypothetical protein ACLGJD_02115 [Gammaproteobacteria bacterium]
MQILMCRFPDREAFLAAALAQGWPLEEGEPAPPPADAALVIHGRRFLPPAEEGAPPVLLPGYWVQALFRAAPPPAFAAAAEAPQPGDPVIPGQAPPPLGPAPVPASVTPLQARRALLQAGLLDEVEAALAAASAETRLAWEYATAIDRDNSLLAGVARQMNMSVEAVDELFRQAGSF